MNTIIRYRGDTAADQFTIKRSGVVVDLTGCTLKLTVNSEKDPVDDTNQLFSVDGVVTSAVNGQVEFAPDGTQADQNPGDYYYDIQLTDADGAILTADKGRYRFKQDITKS